LSVNDLIIEQDQAKAHEHTFLLWPRLWQEYTESHGFSFDWEEHQFLSSEAGNIPNEPGLYTFVIQPNVANHPSCSYLMYLGKTKKLRRRFRDYLREKRLEIGRPKVVNLLNKYPYHTCFCYAVVEDSSILTEMEKALLGAFVPPINKEQFPAKISRIVEALR
jgi:hypothetical protein